MGQMLDKPVSEKSTHRGFNTYSQFAISSMQGYRVTMEDRHTGVPVVEFPDRIKKVVNDDVEVAFYGVYDGHSGM